MCTGWFEVHEP
jgi:hypothetical protein